MLYLISCIYDIYIYASQVDMEHASKPSLMSLPKVFALVLTCVLNPPPIYDTHLLNPLLL
jgi:hypothetical protein